MRLMDLNSAMDEKTVISYNLRLIKVDLRCLASTKTGHGKDIIGLLKSGTVGK